VYFSCSQFVEFVSMSYDFYVMIDICTEQDIRHKIFEHFSCVVNIGTSFQVIVGFSVFYTWT